MSEEKFNTVTHHLLPEQSVSYCYRLWKEYKFCFKIKNKRLSKLGDYRFDPKTDTHIISVNNDLNKFSFLITYIHEIAHLVTFKRHGRRVKPHGEEWKVNFRQLMLPLLHPGVFPDKILRSLAHYLKNPKASSCNDHALMASLRAFDANATTQVTLQEISPGHLFKFRQRTFKKEQLRRTRYVCCEISTQRKYLISKMAEVQKI